MRSLLSTFLLLSVTASAVNAQVIGGNAQPGGNETYTMSVTTRLVVETVVVKDKKGAPIDHPELIAIVLLYFRRPSRPICPHC